MKFKNLAKNTTIFVTISVLMLMSFFCVSAVPEEETTPIVATEAVTVAETEPVTEAPVVEETEPVTEEVQPETQEETEAVTEQETDAPATVVQTQVVEQSTQKTYASTQAITYSLPEATVETMPTAISVDTEKEIGDLTYGYVSWACVIIGILVVVIVLISNKTQYHRGNGKHRYDEGNKITGQKRLLNDDYYNHRKTESYFNKDTRK